jgi:hypothetical protein
MTCMQQKSQDSPKDLTVDYSHFHFHFHLQVEKID